jgi:hypothetical protein
MHGWRMNLKISIVLIRPLLLAGAVALALAGCGSPEPGGQGRIAGAVPALQEGHLSPPIIHFEALEHDFGEMEETESRSHRFLFSNRGESLLFIRDVKVA